MFIVWIPYHEGKEFLRKRRRLRNNPYGTVHGGEISMHGVYGASVSVSVEGGDCDSDGDEEDGDQILFETVPRHGNASWEDGTQMITKYETFRIALIIAPLWFLANVLYNLSLEWTSVSSSTVLSSTGSLFAFFFAVVLKDEKFTVVKFAGICLFVLGSLFTGLSDSDAQTDSCGVPIAAAGNLTSSENAEDDSAAEMTDARIWGDVASLLSAVGYGMYTNALRILCPKDEARISMELLFGYIGVLLVIMFGPVAAILCNIWPNVFPSPEITWDLLLWVALKGLFDNVLSDYLWARSVVLTSATVASVGVGLTIPMAFLCDFVMGRWVKNIHSVVGGIAVLIGFLIVNGGTDHNSNDVVYQTIPEKSNQEPYCDIHVVEDENTLDSAS